MDEARTQSGGVVDARKIHPRFPPSNINAAACTKYSRARSIRGFIVVIFQSSILNSSYIFVQHTHKRSRKWIVLASVRVLPAYAYAVSQIHCFPLLDISLSLSLSLTPSLPPSISKSLITGIHHVDYCIPLVAVEGHL